MYAHNSVEINNKGRFVSWVNDRLVLGDCVVLSIHPKIQKQRGSVIGKTGRLLEVSSTYKITCYKRYPDMAPLDKAPKQQVFGWFYFVVAAVVFLDV